MKYLLLSLMFSSIALASADKELSERTKEAEIEAKYNREVRAIPVGMDIRAYLKTVVLDKEPERADRVLRITIPNQDLTDF